MQYCADAHTTNPQLYIPNGHCHQGAKSLRGILCSNDDTTGCGVDMSSVEVWLGIGGFLLIFIIIFIIIPTGYYLRWTDSYRKHYLSKQNVNTE